MTPAFARLEPLTCAGTKSPSLALINALNSRTPQPLRCARSSVTAGDRYGPSNLPQRYNGTGPVANCYLPLPGPTGEAGPNRSLPRYFMTQFEIARVRSRSCTAYSLGFARGPEY